MILKANEPFSEAALRQAAARLRRQKLEQCALFESPQPEPSEASEARILRTCDRYARCQRTKEYFRTFLAGLLALSLAGGAAAYGNPDLRERIGGWVREVTGTKVLFQKEESSLNNDHLEYFSIHFSDQDLLLLEQERSSGHFFGVIQMQNDVRAYIDIVDYQHTMEMEYSSEEPLKMESGEYNGSRFTFLEGTERHPMANLMVWNDAEEYVIMIDAVLEKEDLLRLYKKIDIERKNQ